MSASAHGLLAGFADEAAFLAALRRLRAEGLKRIEAYTPYAVEYEEGLLPPMRSPVPAVMFLAGLGGAGGGFYLQWYAAHDYPLNIGGRPLASWPSFIPITFELTVLCAALCGLGAMLYLAGLPRLHHPVFADPHFARASQDRFFLCVRADDPAYAPERLGRLFASLQADSVTELPT